jgi:hypothetical protein
MDEPQTNQQKALEYGFKWFEYHAQQRITSFHFYLIAYSGLAAAEAFLLKETFHFGSMLIGLVMIFTSVLFWQLDVRNRQLIEIGELIISQGWLEGGLDSHLNPIHLSRKTQSEGLRFKYIFGIVFMLGGIAGLGTLAYAIYLTPV